MLKEANLEMAEWRVTPLPSPKIGVIRKKLGLSYLLPKSFDAIYFDVKTVKI